MSAHTPGPWTAQACYDGGRTVCEMRSPDRLICVNAAEDAEPRGYEATDANARLIAAAPDLLAALKGFDAFSLERDVNETDYPDYWPLLEACRAAIAKAEGRAQ